MIIDGVDPPLQGEHSGCEATHGRKRTSDDLACPGRDDGRRARGRAGPGG